MNDNPYQAPRIPAQPAPAAKKPQQTHPLQAIGCLIQVIGWCTMLATLLLGIWHPKPAIVYIWTIGFVMTIVPGSITMLVWLVKRRSKP